MDNHPISFRPGDLAEGLDEFADKHGLDRLGAVRALLRHALDNQPTTPPVPAKARSGAGESAIASREAWIALRSELLAKLLEHNAGPARPAGGWYTYATIRNKVWRRSRVLPDEVRRMLGELAQSGHLVSRDNRRLTRSYQVAAAPAGF